MAWRRRGYRRSYNYYDDESSYRVPTKKPRRITEPLPESDEEDLNVSTFYKVTHATWKTTEEIEKSYLERSDIEGDPTK